LDPDDTMLLWIVMAVLAAAASLAVLVPLYRGHGAARASEPAMAIYRDQLAEIDRDLGRGLIDADEAGAARTEIARRLIRAGDERDQAVAAGTSGRRQWWAAAAVIAMPVAALAFYTIVGSPELPDQPLADRLSAPLETQDIATLMARVEDHLAANPEDGQGWEVVAPVYMQLNRFDDAVRAYANVARILGPTAGREADLGEAIVAANGGVVTNEASDAFERAKTLDPKAIKPRFFLALALTQEKRQDEAAAAWRGLLADATSDAPWAAYVRQQLADLGAEPPPPAAVTPGPSAEDVEAAGQMSAEDRLAMIEGMVGSLAARLEADPGDVDGWARLIRSYMVLDRPEDASVALGQARIALADDSEKLAQVNAFAESLGVSE
jgi:cytochrome c-type biogenesis protein CcmH